jgi:glutamyl-tRNA synthetase
VQAILDGMQWLGIGITMKGPSTRCSAWTVTRQVIGEMLAAGTAYHCYMSREELDALRAEQEAKQGKAALRRALAARAGQDAAACPRPRRQAGGAFPQSARRAWSPGMTRSRAASRFANSELDDFIIARDDGTPTYNFCVVVDDWDMKITHVIRGDDHVNNTPRQINVLQGARRDRCPSTPTCR